MEKELSIGAPSPTKAEPKSDTREKRKEVLQLVQKEGPLTKKELDFCDDACTDRYLKARGNSVRRASRMLRATLNWREKIEIGYMIADEFPADIAAGSAYVAGHDEQGRPVLIIKKKPDHILNRTQKQYLRYLIFTIEVALASMTPGVDQWVLIFDARGYSKASAPSPSGILTTLKILSDHYPERLAKVFIVDASSMFYHIWKGMCTFVDHPTRGKLHFGYTRDYRRTSKPPLISQAIPVSPSSSHSPRRPSNAFVDDLYPVSPQSGTRGRNEVSLPTVCDASPMIIDQGLARSKLSDGPELIHSVRTRSFSFSSVMTMSYTAPEPREGESSSFRKEAPEEEIVDEEPEVAVTLSVRSKPCRGPWDGLVSIFHSQKKDDVHRKDECKKHPSRKDESVAIEEQKKDELRKDEHKSFKPAASFLPYLSFVQEPYSETSYRALMKPPLGGLAMIISSEMKRLDSF